MGRPTPIWAVEALRLVLEEEQCARRNSGHGSGLCRDGLKALCEIQGGGEHLAGMKERLEFLNVGRLRLARQRSDGDAVFADVSSILISVSRLRCVSERRRGAHEASAVWRVASAEHDHAA